MKRCRGLQRRDRNRDDIVSMKEKKLRIGMVGVGGFGARRRERMRETGLFELVAVYDLNLEAAIFEDSRPWAGEHGQWIQRVPPNLDGSIEARVPLVMEKVSDDCANLRSFHRAVTEGGVPYPSALDGARALAPVFAAARAAESGQWVDVEHFAE